MLSNQSRKKVQKITYYSVVLISFLSTKPVLSSQMDVSDVKSSRSSCQQNSTLSNLKLNFSQKSTEKNEFLVGWNFFENHDYHRAQKPEVGGEVVIVRCLPPGRYVAIAKGTVNQLNGSMVEARVMSTNYDELTLGKYTQNLVESRNLIWRPMVGDEVFPLYKQVERASVASPLFQLGNKNLFVKQDEGGFSFTLSEDGQSLLREKFEKLRNENGRLLIEGFILTAGDRDKLRTESLMRAQAVSTFLIREFSLQPSQVVPIGYGNDWIQTGMQPVGTNYSRYEDDGVILKILK